MSKNVRKIVEILIFSAIIILSVVIFLNKDRITDVSGVGYIGLMFLCFLANSTVLLPAPSLMIAASCALIMNPWLVAICAALGSTLGEFVGYLFGSVSKDISEKFKKLLDKIFLKIKNQVVIVFILALLPLPLFDIIGIYSGATRMNLAKFFFACYFGKLLKLVVYINFFDYLAGIIS